MSKSNNQKLSKRIEFLVSRVLDIDKRKVMAVEDLSLLNAEEKNASSTANMVSLPTSLLLLRVLVRSKP
jgi:hypothetical protein